MIIYQIENVVNGDLYVGKTTKSIETRFKRHYYNHKDGTTHLYKAMRKYGFENFVVSIIEETNNLDEREMYWISKLSPRYNMTKGGEGGDTSKSPNYIEGMKSRDLSGPKNPMYGRKRTDTAVYLNLAKDKMIQANRCPVSCEGVIYTSVGEAQTAYPGCSIRKRLDNPKYANFYRLKDKITRK